MLIAPSASIFYNSLNISEDIRRDLVSLTYTDNIEGESDEVVLELFDTDGRWRESFYPDKGATLDVDIQAGTASLPCGSFLIEELDYRFSPDTLTIRALGAGAAKAMRTKRSRAYENVTLKDIAQRIAAAYGLSVEGDIRPVQFARRTQHREKDLTFLQKLALEFGYTFSVRADKLVFVSLESLQSAAPALQISKDQVSSATFRDQSIQVYKEAKARYYNPATAQLVEASSVGASDASEDSFEIRGRLETVSQANESATGATTRNKYKKVEARISTNGNVALVAGLNISLNGFGSKFDGTYNIVRSTHAVSQGGYTTEIEASKTA